MVRPRTASVSLMFSSAQVILFSEDLERTVGFYVGLGFTETFRVPATGEAIHVDLALDGYKLGIASAASVRDDHGLDPVTRGQRAAVVLWTEDVRAAHAELVAGGAPELKPPHEWLGRLLISWIADPDGNPIQLVQHLRAVEVVASDEDEDEDEEAAEETTFWLSQPGIGEDLAQAEDDIVAGRVHDEAHVREALDLPPRR